MVTAPSVAHAESLMGLPGGVYFTALSSRLINTCSISTLSRGTSGKSAGRCVVNGRSRELRLQACQGCTHHFFQRLPLRVHLDSAGLEPRHLQ